MATFLFQYAKYLYLVHIYISQKFSLSILTTFSSQFFLTCFLFVFSKAIDWLCLLRKFQKSLSFTLYSSNMGSQCSPAYQIFISRSFLRVSLASSLIISLSTPLCTVFFTLVFAANLAFSAILLICHVFTTSSR